MRSTRTLVSIAVLCLGLGLASSASAEGIKMSGFVDAQFGWENQTSNSPGFTLDDAALYMISNVGGGSAMIDLPFNSKAIDSNDLKLGEDKAQAFVSFKYKDGVWWKLGQWDSHLGMEARDANGRRFARKSILIDNRLPNTHLGLWTGWSRGMVGVSFLITDPPDTGGFNGANPPLGGRIWIGSDDFLKFTLNVLYHTRRIGTDIWYNLFFKANMKPLTLAAEGIYFHPNVRVAEVGDRGYGGGVMLDYELDRWYEGLDFGVRGEYILQYVKEREAELTAGLRYAMTKNMNLKLDYAYEIEKATDKLVRSLNHSVKLATTYTF